jgi:hypothetical protein
MEQRRGVSTDNSNFSSLNTLSSSFYTPLLSYRLSPSPISNSSLIRCHSFSLLFSLPISLPSLILTHSLSFLILSDSLFSSYFHSLPPLLSPLLSTLLSPLSLPFSLPLSLPFSLSLPPLLPPLSLLLFNSSLYSFAETG